jgi:hypothetical protein
MRGKTKRKRALNQIGAPTQRMVEIRESLRSVRSNRQNLGYPPFLAGKLSQVMVDLGQFINRREWAPSGPERPGRSGAGDRSDFAKGYCERLLQSPLVGHASPASAKDQAVG